MNDLHVPLSPAQIGHLVDRGVKLDDGLVFLLEHPDAFVAHYFPHRLLRLEAFHLRLISAYCFFTRSLTLYPAAHGKTTLDGGCLPIWDIARDPNIRLTYIGKTDDDAASVMLGVQAELEENERLIRDFGPFKPGQREGKTWRTGRIDVVNRTIRDIRGTLEVIGSGGNIFGHRTDRVICDDVVTDKNSLTPEQRLKLREWFNLGVETMCEEDDDHLTVVGTRFHPQDLYGDLIELRDPFSDEPMYHVQWEDAIVDEERHLTLWPERWTWTRLMQTKAKAGTLDFNKRYRNIAVDPARMKFREEFVKGGYLDDGTKHPGCLDRDFEVGEWDPGWRRLGGFDPAIGTGRGHSWAVYTVVAVGSCAEHETCLWIVDMERDTMPVTKQIALILDMHNRYKLTEARIESNAYQKGLAGLIAEKMGELGVAWKIEPHHTGANKVDPEIGVEALSPWFEQGRVHIPWRSDYSRRKMQPLVDELISYPSGRHDDCVMALWIASIGARDMGVRYESFYRPIRSITRPARGSRWGQWSVQNPIYQPEQENEQAPV